MLNKNLEIEIAKFVNALGLPENKGRWWFSEKEIRCFREEGVRQEAEDYVCNCIRRYIEGNDLDFKIINYGINPNSTENIRKSTKRDGLVIDTDLLSSGILRNEPWRYEKGNQHGDILVVKTHLSDYPCHTNFFDGNLIVDYTVANEASNENLLREYLDELFGYNFIGRYESPRPERKEVLPILWKEIFKRMD
jgi:hypothetical protein